MASVTESSLPIDTSVEIPAVIKQAAAAAEAAHKAAYGDQTVQTTTHVVQDTTPPPVPQHTEVPPTPIQTEAQPPAPPVEPPPVELGDAAQEHHRYLSMKGRYEQATLTIGQMQEQMQQLGDELVRTQRAVQQRPQQQQPRPQPQKLLTDKDVEAYGPELIDLVQRAAREAVSPDLAQLQQTTQQVRQRVVQQTQQGVYQALAAAVPNWEEINDSPRFKNWAALRDIYSGELRGKLLNAALQAADAPRVIAFFRGFLAEEIATGQVTDPQVQQHQQSVPRTAAIPLSSLAAPGKARPATGSTAVPVEKPVFTRAQIAEFYTNVRKGAYAGRDQDKQVAEEMIFAAQREGRVRG